MSKKLIRSYLLTGLVVWLPILVTFVVLRFIVDLLDQSTALLPHAYQPQQLIGYAIPGVGVLLSLLILLLTGISVTNFLGQRLMRWSESILERIPLVRSVYNGTKQVIQTIFSSNSQAFRKVLLVQYPRHGMWSVAFQTSLVPTNIASQVGIQEEMITIFIPTTPNPTSGFLMMVPKTDVVELTMSVDDAFKYIISLGVMQATEALHAESKQVVKEEI